MGDGRPRYLTLLILIGQMGFLPEEAVDKYVNQLYNELGVQDVFFKTEPVEKIAEFVVSIYAARLTAYAKHRDRVEDLVLEHSTGTGWTITARHKW
jgi:glutamate dehydrogenase